MTNSETGSGVQGSDSSVELVCRPVCHCITLLEAKFGLPLMFLSLLKSVFEARIPALHLLPLVSLNRNLRHRLPLFPAVMPPAKFDLPLSYHLFHQSPGLFIALLRSMLIWLLHLGVVILRMTLSLRCVLVRNGTNLPPLLPRKIPLT